MKKKLFFAAVDLNIGGIEKALVNLLNSINYEKYEVTLVLEKKEGPLLDMLNKNVIVRELKVSNNKIVFIRKIVNCFRKMIFKLKNTNKYDFSCCYATYSYSAVKLALMASKNSSIYIHSDYTYIYNEKEFYDFFNTHNIGSFKRIIFVSNESRDNFKKYYPNFENKLLVFNNFIDVDDIKNKSLENVELSFNNNKKHLVFVGRLDDKSKKLGRAIELVKNINDIDLLVVGDGPDRNKYENYVKENNLQKRIVFVGSKKNPYPYIKNSDYLILTSNYEGFPVIYLEAIVLNKYIITTINTSDDQINISDGFGYIISKDEEKMIKEVKEFLKRDVKIKTIDFKEIQKKRMEALEEIFNEVI